jgi:fatty-acid desaturase
MAMGCLGVPENRLYCSDDEADIRHPERSMKLVPGSERIIADDDTNPLEGDVRWVPTKSLWIGVMTATSVALGPLLASWDAFILFVVTSALTLCFGHSVGMHRRLIHASFECPLWVEHFCVYLGTLVGMAGPYGMIRLHDFRDWAQRQSMCHDYSCHRSGFWRDAWWQLHCKLVLKHPPKFRLEPRLADDGFYAFVERTWMWQQLPRAILFFTIGGSSWLVWGICVRVSVCVIGHWLIGHFCHRKGSQTWVIGSRVQRQTRWADQHGRMLAQQPSRLSRFGKDGPFSRPDRSGLVAHQGA